MSLFESFFFCLNQMRHMLAQMVYTTGSGSFGVSPPLVTVWVGLQQTHGWAFHDALGWALLGDVAPEWVAVLTAEQQAAVQAACRQLAAEQRKEWLAQAAGYAANHLASQKTILVAQTGLPARKIRATEAVQLGGHFVVHPSDVRKFAAVGLYLHHKALSKGLPSPVSADAAGMIPHIDEVDEEFLIQADAWIEELKKRKRLKKRK
jgi:hypothetical protein